MTTIREKDLLTLVEAMDEEREYTTAELSAKTGFSELYTTQLLLRLSKDKVVGSVKPEPRYAISPKAIQALLRAELIDGEPDGEFHLTAHARQLHARGELISAVGRAWGMNLTPEQAPVAAALMFMLCGETLS